MSAQDRRKRVCAPLVKARTLRAVRVNINQPRRNEPPCHIDVWHVAGQFIGRANGTDAAIGNQQRLPLDHLVGGHNFPIDQG
jgi:hypothetical protein